MFHFEWMENGKQTIMKNIFNHWLHIWQSRHQLLFGICNRFKWFIPGHLFPHRFDSIRHFFNFIRANLESIWVSTTPRARQKRVLAQTWYLFWWNGMTVENKKYFRWYCVNQTLGNQWFSKNLSNIFFFSRRHNHWHKCVFIVRNAFEHNSTI